jgi:hypothetical protein
MALNWKWSHQSFLFCGVKLKIVALDTFIWKLIFEAFHDFSRLEHLDKVSGNVEVFSWHFV